jgi:hypothetical protein
MWRVEKKDTGCTGAEGEYPSSSGSSSKAVVLDTGEHMAFTVLLPFLLAGLNASSSGNADSTDERMESDLPLLDMREGD